MEGNYKCIKVQIASDPDEFLNMSFDRIVRSSSATPDRVCGTLVCGFEKSGVPFGVLMTRIVVLGGLKGVSCFQNSHSSRKFWGCLQVSS